MQIKIVQLIELRYVNLTASASCYSNPVYNKTIIFIRDTRDHFL